MVPETALRFPDDVAADHAFETEAGRATPPMNIRLGAGTGVEYSGVLI